MFKKIFQVFVDSPDTFEGQEEGEKVVLLLRKHSIVLYTQLGISLLLALLPVMAYIFFEYYINEYELAALYLFGASLYYMLLWLATFRTMTLYTLNTVIITDRRIIDKEQSNFFNQKVSEFHVSRIQDVTVHTRGIVQTVFRFGEVFVQTAASETHFQFHQIPEPHQVRAIIMNMVAKKKREIRPTGV